MIRSMRKDTDRAAATSSLDLTAASGLRACVAALVLAWTTGVPLHSVENFLPHAGKQTTPYLGV